MVVNKRWYQILLSAIVLAGLLTTSLISYFVAKHSLMTRVEQETLPLTSDSIHAEIEKDLLQPLLIASLMANDVFVFDWVQAGEQDTQRMTTYLAQIQAKYHVHSTFFVSEASARYYHPSGMLKTVSPQDPADHWYFASRQSGPQPYLINIDHDTADPQHKTVFINHRVVNQNGQFIGVIGVGLSMQAVMQRIEDYQRRYGRQIYFVDPQGRLMLHSSQHAQHLLWQHLTIQDPARLALMTGEGATRHLQTAQGHTVYLTSRKIPQFNWFLIIEQEEAPGTESITSALLINMVVSITVSVIVLLLAHFATRNYRQTLETMATQDKLTGAASRQVFEFYFGQAVARSKRRDEPLSLVLLDIDFFKLVNDRYGHQAGDAVLSQLVEVIRAHVREEDVVCRWGGEEFLLMLSDCDLAHAKDVAEIIRSAVTGAQFHFRQHVIKITISGGIAEVQSSESLFEVVARADLLLYEAKHAGRNCFKPEID